MYSTTHSIMLPNVRFCMQYPFLSDIKEFSKWWKLVTQTKIIECHDCGEMSKCFEERQGVSMGGIVYDYAIGECCRKNYAHMETEKCFN